MLSKTLARRLTGKARPWPSSVGLGAMGLCALGVLLSMVGWQVLRGTSTPDGADQDRAAYRAVQTQRSYGLAQGKFLIAQRTLMDPNFAQTVVLLFQHDEKGSVGLIINRPTTIKLSKAVDHFQQWEGEDDRIYEGGPVARRRVIMLVRTDDEIEGAHPVFDDVHLGASNGLLQSLANGWDKPKAFRAYTGYAGWGAGQLEGEMKRGSWHVLPAKGDLVFDPNPERVWTKLIEQTNLRWAEANGVRGRHAGRPVFEWHWKVGALGYSPASTSGPLAGSSDRANSRPSSRPCAGA